MIRVWFHGLGFGFWIVICILFSSQYLGLVPVKRVWFCFILGFVFKLRWERMRRSNCFIFSFVFVLERIFEGQRWLLPFPLPNVLLFRFPPKALMAFLLGSPHMTVEVGGFRLLTCLPTEGGEIGRIWPIWGLPGWWPAPLSGVAPSWA